MQNPRRVLSLSLMLFSAVASAELLQPECAALERWARDFNSEARVRLSPQVQMPASFQDGTLASHFGRPLMEWDRNDFRAAQGVFNDCGKQARLRRDRAGATQLQTLRNAINAQERGLREIQQALERARAAVQSLAAAPDSPALIDALRIAQAALRGEEVRPRLREIAHEPQRQIMQLSYAYPHLLETDNDALSTQLGERLSAAEGALRAEEQAALAQLRSAQADLAAIPETAEGLQELERLQQHPALARVPADKAAAFRSALQQRRDEIQTVQREQQAKAAAMAVDQALEELQAMEVAQLQDLGRLWDFGDRTSRRLAEQGAYGEARRFVAAFRQRFAGASEQRLPEFRARLAEIPASEDGLRQLGGAVRNLTGITNLSAPLDAYRQAVDERGQVITAEIKRAACEQSWQAAGLSAREAKQALWGAGEATTLGMFVCALSERGHRISRYEDAGMFSDVHTLKFTEKGGAFRALKLHPGEVRPGEEMLLGYELSDANQTRALSVEEWEDYAGKLVGGDSADCDRLADKSRGELSLNESMMLMGCVMDLLPGT